MADTTALKNRIRAAIKANDNQEITGPVLQQALLDMVDELNGATETEAEQRQNQDSQILNTVNQKEQTLNNSIALAIYRTILYGNTVAIKTGTDYTKVIHSISVNEELTCNIKFNNFLLTGNSNKDVTTEFYKVANIDSNGYNIPNTCYLLFNIETGNIIVNTEGTRADYFNNALSDEKIIILAYNMWGRLYSPITSLQNELYDYYFTTQSINSLQQAIHNLRDAGYAFGGIAVVETNPGVPSGNCFYIARGAGTYTYFKNADDESIVLENDGIYVFTYESVENNYWEYNDIIKIDNSVTKNSKNIITSGAVEQALSEIIKSTSADFAISDEDNFAIVKFENGHVKTKNFDSSNLNQTIDNGDADFAISDEDNFAIVKFENGHVKTKNFDSSNLNQTIDNGDADFAISDENSFVIVKFENGHIKTKNFDSSEIQNKLIKKELVHFILLGQSLSVGYNSTPVLPSINIKNAYMFGHVRTFDAGYNQNVSRATYNPSQEDYDEQFYQVRQLKEEAGFGYNASKWIPFSGAEGETVCSGIAEMLEKLYKEQGYNGIPFSSIFTCGGIGATSLEVFGDGETGCFEGYSSDIFERCKKDIKHAQNFASELGFAYHPIMVWMQGEGNSNSEAGYPERTFEYCKQTYEDLHTVYDNYLKSVGVKSELQIFLYQTDANRYQHANNVLAQFDIALKKDWAHLTYPVYNLQKITPNDYTHLTNLSERLYGNCIGSVVFDYFNKGDILFKITKVVKDGNNLYVHFNKKVVVDIQHMNNLESGAYDSTWVTNIKNTLGFFPVDANGDIAFNTSEGAVVAGQVTLTDDNVILIACSATPVKLMYGYRQDNTAQKATTGGAIRVDDELIGYNDNNVYRYLPQQLIESFESVYEFSFNV